jgi:hypothetical protein
MANDTKTAPATVAMGNVEELQAQLAKLQKENDALKARPGLIGGQITVKCPKREPKLDKDGKQEMKDGKPVMKGGNTSIYGLGSFPTSLYISQSNRLFKPETVLQILEEQSKSFENLIHKGDNAEEIAKSTKEDRDNLNELLGIFRGLVNGGKKKA